MLIQLQESEGALKESWQSCLKRAELAESAHQLLEEEHARVQGELEAHECHVEQLEQQVAEEKRRREEEVGGLERQLEQEQKSREEEVAEHSQVIIELKAQASSGPSLLSW